MTNGLPEPTAAQPLTQATAPQGWSNRGVAAIVVACMVVVAVVALIYALQTVGFRRSNDVKGPPPEGPPLMAGALVVDLLHWLTGLGRA